jgi:DUF4097 and DUF4098 domain-containing protein YvlB
MAASAQQNVDARRGAAPDGVVAIDNGAGSVRVVGWARPEVSVTGQLGVGATGLELSGTGSRTEVEVNTEGNPHGVQSQLEVRVPAGSRVEVEGFAADVTVTGVTGTVSVETVNGSISVGPGAKEVDAETVNGSVEVGGTTVRVGAESVNGAVTVRGARGEVEASTVNGALTVTGEEFRRARLETVAGGITFEGSLAADASLDLETVSGPVSVTLPADVSADFRLSTFSGSLDNSFGPAPAGRRHTPRKELDFTTGGGGASVTVSTLSGGIVLRKR